MTIDLNQIASVITMLMVFINFAIILSKPWKVGKEKRELEAKAQAEKDRNLELRLSAFDARLLDTEKAVRDNQKSLAGQAELNAMLLKAVATLMAHEVDGNHTDQLTKCVDEINRYLYKEGGSL